MRPPKSPVRRLGSDPSMGKARVDLRKAGLRIDAGRRGPFKGRVGQDTDEQSVPRPSRTVNSQPTSILGVLRGDRKNLKDETTGRDGGRITFAVSRLAVRYGPIKIAPFGPEDVATRVAAQPDQRVHRR